MRDKLIKKWEKRQKKNYKASEDSDMLIHEFICDLETIKNSQPSSSFVVGPAEAVPVCNNCKVEMKKVIPHPYVCSTCGSRK